MDLLCSITKMVVEGGSTSSTPGAVPLAGDSRPLRKESRRRFATATGIVGGGGAGSSGSGGGFASPPGEFYRLPWYRRPLPSNRRTSIGSVGAQFRRSSSMIVAPRAGVRAARGSTGGGGTAENTPVAGAAPSAAGREGEDANATPKQQQQQRQRAGSDLPGCSPATAPGSRSSPPTGPHSNPPPPSYVRSPAPVFGGVEDRRTATAVASPATGVVTTPTANSMAADRGSISPTAEGSGKRSDGANAAAAAAAAAASELSASHQKDADSGEVKRLRAEVDRLKREMAALAAAAAKDITTPPQQQSSGRRRSPRLEVTSPALSSSPAAKHHSSWDASDTCAVEGEELSSAKRGAPRPMSTRLRADNSWMQRRRSGGDGDIADHRKSGDGPSSASHRRNSSGSAARVGSPSSRSSVNNERGRAPSDEGVGGDECRSLSPAAKRLDVGGPSPTSGDKGGRARAEANDRRGKHCSVDSIDEAGAGDGTSNSGAGGEDRGSGSADSDDSSMRQMSVFFPVQNTPDSKADLDGAASVEGAAALAAAAATQIGAAVSPPEAVRAARAARNAAVSARQQQLQQQQQKKQQLLQQQGPAGYAPSAPVVYAKIPERGPPAGEEEGGGGRGESRCRRCSASGSKGKVWRWVLVQRMGNLQVRQAVLSHGLPSYGRRHIWAAWASVAMPET